MTTTYKNIDEYIEQCPESVRPMLQQIRQAIHEAAPDAKETISYSMPAFKQNGILVYFAAFKKHIGFFPTPSGVAAFEKELSRYTVSKGTIRLPFERPVPVGLIKRIVRFRVQEDAMKNSGSST
jgi:uncharacterized protein YdhG (YjbR/CyaY superfamily)